MTTKLDILSMVTVIMIILNYVIIAELIGALCNTPSTSLSMNAGARRTCGKIRLAI